jgi:hypothetical protein
MDWSHITSKSTPARPIWQDFFSKHVEEANYILPLTQPLLALVDFCHRANGFHNSVAQSGSAQQELVANRISCGEGSIIL